MKYIAVVFLGGGLGAVLRYLIAHLFGSIHLPIPTFIANMLGCFIIGLAMPFFMLKADTPMLRLFVVTGFLGGLTTFSTFTYETIQLFDSATPIFALTNIAGNVICGLILALLGTWLSAVFI